MATIKSYTDLEQSKKLAEILPLDSADMAWCNNSIRGVNYIDPFSANLHTVKEMREAFDEALRGWDKYWELVPCWSLTALLNVMPKDEGIESSISFGFYNGKGEYIEKWLCAFEKEGETTDDYIIVTIGGDNPVDACVNMIIRLKELKLL